MSPNTKSPRSKCYHQIFLLSSVNSLVPSSVHLVLWDTETKKSTWTAFVLASDSEVIYVDIIPGQLFLMDRFLDGTFFTFGIEVISFAMRDEEDRVDPVIYIFPRMTKCTFHKFGTSGNIESHDALCILPINIVNEKIYVFLWFWFLLLGTLTLLVVLYRLIIIFSPRMRAYLLFIRFRLIKKECINVIIKKTQMGDWFLLYMLGQNVDSMIFKEVIHELARRLGYSSKDLIDFWGNWDKNFHQYGAIIFDTRTPFVLSNHLKVVTEIVHLEKQALPPSLILLQQLLNANYY